MSGAAKAACGARRNFPARKLEPHSFEAILPGDYAALLSCIVTTDPNAFFRVPMAVPRGSAGPCIERHHDDPASFLLQSSERVLLFCLVSVAKALRRGRSSWN